MSSPLEPFLALIETNFPLGGPRRHLIDLLGRDLVGELETAKLLTYQRMADTYPCPHPGGDGCPRQVFEMPDGTYHAVCGNDPRECDDLVLKQEDVEHLSVEPKALCDSVARALQVRSRFEELDGLRGVFHVGTFIPEAGIRQPVFLVVRCSDSGYSEVLDALRSREERDAFAVLVPTDRFIADDVARQMSSMGIPLLQLDDVIGVDDGKLTALVDPLTYFGRIGQTGPGTTTTAPSVVVQALVCDGKGKPSWRNLDERQYRELVAAAGKYLIFADERSRTSARTKKNKREKKDKLLASYFQLLRACAEHRGYYDPATDLRFDGVFDDPKQTLVRARQHIDVKVPQQGAKDDYAIFKTRLVDRHSVYEFEPTPGVAFALLFRPSS
ncbi:MAG: hypothetical protein CSB49_04045 [Proteobacteria bacterium]|nr:MAG: hypothetical protein CSB49_04045 [Pseudomonadota bacterium]